MVKPRHGKRQTPEELAAHKERQEPIDEHNEKLRIGPGRAERRRQQSVDWKKLKKLVRHELRQQQKH